MKVTLRGVRGSLPAPRTPLEIRHKIHQVALECGRRGLKSDDDVTRLLNTLPSSLYGGFGGNTSCVEVSTARQTILIDAGSGIRGLGLELSQPREVHIFMTHFHWDHLIGLMFFQPIFVPGNTIHFYAVQPELEQIIRTLFKKPYFPVNYESLGSKLAYHQLEPRKIFEIGDLQLTPYELDHPDPCWGYRIHHQNKVFSYCVDTECLRTTEAELGPDLPLYQGVDVMAFDAQYTIAEAAQRVNWGHAAAPIGLDLAMRENIKNVYFVHHDPNASDEAIAEAENQTRDYYETHLSSERKAGRRVHEVRWKFAQEGEVIDMGDL